jgi:hypothetical protein
MTPVLEIAFHVLELIASFTAGAWIGRSRCHLAIELDSEEERRQTWLDRCFPCRPRSVSWRRGKSDVSEKSTKSI